METKIKVLEQKLEEGKSRESQLRSNNKVGDATSVLAFVSTPYIHPDPP